MSVIIRVHTGMILLMCKGADSAMLPLAKGWHFDEMEETVPNEDVKLAWLQSHLDAFSVRGLRTLVLGLREISEDEFVAWNTQCGYKGYTFSGGV